MGLNIVAGRAKTGKSTYIYDNIKRKINNNNANLILIVPEQMTYQAEYEIIDRIDEQGIMAAEILSFTRLGYKVLEEVGNLKVQELNSYGKIMMLKQIFEDNKEQLKFFGKAIRQEGFLGEFDALIGELKQNCVSAEFLEQITKYNDDSKNRMLGDKLEDITKIYLEINKRTQDRFFDEEDKINLFIDAIQNSYYIKNSVVWIDGFDSFNMQRHMIIKELIKYAKDVTVSLNIEAASLKNLHCTEDWEAFKTVYDTYNTLTGKLECPANIIPLNSTCLSEEMAVIEKNLFSVNGTPYAEETGSIQFFSSLNPYSETERMAEEIVTLVRDRGYRWKDISVALGDMDSYGINIKKVFSRYDIPYFLDYKRDIMGNPLTKFILSLLDMFIYNFRHDSVFEFLKTGFYSLNYDEVSKLENFALQYGIEGGKWFGKFKFNAYDIDYYNDLREKFTAGLNKARKKFSSIKTALDITMFIFDFLKSCKVQEKIEKQVDIFKFSGLYELSSENAQIWNYVIGVFEQIVIAGADIEITPREYRKMIEAGFKEVKINIIPPTLDKVTVGEADKISAKSSKVIFVMGANEGMLDSKKNENGLLLDDERKSLAESGMKLLNDSDYYIYKEKHMLYKLLTGASDKLYISYAMGTEEGKALQPSIYVERLRQLFPLVRVQSDLGDIDESVNVSNHKGTVEHLISAVRDFVEGRHMDDIWKDVYSWYEENEHETALMINQGLMYKNQAGRITEDNLKKIYQPPIAFSVSKLENFAACPFKFFVENIIKPQPRLVQKVEFYDLGNIYHKSVEKFTKKIYETGTNIEELDKETVDSVSRLCTDEVLNGEKMNYTAFDSNWRNKYMKEKIKRLMSRAANTIIGQLKKGDFRPVYTELSIGNTDSKCFIEPLEIKLSNDTVIYFQGRIDRVDILKKDGRLYVNIIDYKSSFKNFDLSDVVQGLQLQLLVYMSAVVKNGEKLFKIPPKIGGVYYFRIDDPMIDGDRITEKNREREIFKQLSLKGYVVDDTDIIAGMDRGILSDRKSDIIPVTFNKNGSASKSSKILTVDEFKALLDKTDEIARDLTEKIIKGTIDIMPYRKEPENKTPCSYCDYTGICQFDQSMDGNNYRKIKKLKKDEILFEILNKGGDDA